MKPVQPTPTYPDTPSTDPVGPTVHLLYPSIHTSIFLFVQRRNIKLHLSTTAGTVTNDIIQSFISFMDRTTESEITVLMHYCWDSNNPLINEIMVSEFDTFRCPLLVIRKTSSSQHCCTSQIHLSVLSGGQTIEWSSWFSMIWTHLWYCSSEVY